MRSAVADGRRRRAVRGGHGRSACSGRWGDGAAAGIASRCPRARGGEAATGHQGRGAIEGRWHTYPELAAAGLWTTAEDLARFGLAVSRAWKGESPDILSRELAREMLTRQGAGNYGLGLIVRGTGQGLVVHPRRRQRGLREPPDRLPETGQGAVVMTNANGSKPLIEALIGRDGLGDGRYGGNGRQSKRLRRDGGLHFALV